MFKKRLSLLCFQAMLRHHDKKGLVQKFYFGLQFQRDKSPSWQGGMAASGWCAGRSRKLTDLILNCKQEVERMNWKWGEAMNSQSLPPSDVLLPESLHLLKTL